ncbi:hypothetical protein [Okeania sp. SIO1I7]|uniref:hypothetical protein n=1 Tax=Okeania sp. SIO1I7 TaxID=2607772 RepID=UPI0013FCD02B|nr:hypothetical protein [Okeania sp. SIO1I7]NET27067.1 hypothetical protein [Okeania sp. SIO1I7]
MNCDILVIGTGSVSQVFCYAIALAFSESLKVCVIGRSKNSVDQVVTIANARSVAFSSTVTFIGDSIDWDSENDLSDKLATYSPRLILQTASLQSPWEFTASQSAWCSLIKEGGFGITLPLQAALVAQVASLIKRTMPTDSILVNVCYPDAVNPLLSYLGLPIVCGAGNVGIISTLLQSLLNLDKTRHFQVIAHHSHVINLAESPEDRLTELEGLRIWSDGQQFHQIDTLLSPIQSIKGEQINQIVGCLSAEVVLALLGSSPVHTHVPGPNGLPGGYPVVVQEGKVELALPQGCTIAEAIELNRRAAIKDGVEAIDTEGFIRWNQRAFQAIKQYAPSLAEGFRAEDLQIVCQEFIKLRNRLRKE